MIITRRVAESKKKRFVHWKRKEGLQRGARVK